MRQRHPVLLRARSRLGASTRAPAARSGTTPGRRAAAIHIGNRGVGIYGNWLYFLTPDNYFVSLDAATGKERWHHEIANMKREYFSTNAPIVIGNHVIIGVGGDALDVPGYLESRDPETGDLHVALEHDAAARRAGRRDLAERVRDVARRRHAVAAGTYDPELNLYYFGTGNPNPVLAGQSRAGDNLYTCSIVALNPDTGKMAWYYQVTPHDTHDWDAAQTPVLIDGVIDGRPRKLRRAGQPQRPLLPARSHERRAHPDDEASSTR